MKILMTAHGFPPRQIGGTQLHTLDLALALRARGHQVEVLCPERTGEDQAGRMWTEEVQGVRAHRLAVPEPAGNPGPEDFRLTYDNPLAEGAFRRLARELGPDMVHFHHFFDLSASMALAARDMGLPAALTLHDLWVLCEQPHFLLPDLTYCQAGPISPQACADCLAGRRPGWSLARSPEVLRECFRERQDFLRAAVASLSGVVCLAGFQARRLAAHGFAPRATWRAPLGLPASARLARPRPRRPGDDIRLACLGLVAPSKGTDLVVTALGLAGWEGFRLDAHGIVCDQVYLEAMRRSHPPGRVRWRGGYLPKDLPGILAEADAVVMPSRSENTPLVVMESLGAGKPVVGADVGGVAEMLGRGRWGLVFANGDAPDLARALARLRDEPGLLETLRDNVPAQRTIEDEAVDLEAVYRQCLSRP